MRLLDREDHSLPRPGFLVVALALLSLPLPLTAAGGQALMTIPPCRAVDTRNPADPLGGPALNPNETRLFTLTGACGVPPTALGLAVNLTVVSPAEMGYAQLYAGDAATPPTLVLAFSAGKTRASNTIVALASDNTGTVALANVSAGAADFIIDISGYWVPACTSTITVTNPLTASGTVNVPFSQTFTSSGGTGTKTYTTASPLPAGLTLAPNGTLSGTPTRPGTFPITVTATDANGCTGTGATYTLVISCQTITVTNPVTATGTANVFFSQTFVQTGGVGTTTFTTASALPIGMTLAASGVLSGTPTQAGGFDIVVTATDANGCTGSGATYRLVINCQAITVTNPATTTGTAGAFFSQTFTQTGAIGGATFTTASTLPAGLNLAANGVLAGTPTQTGLFPIVVTVTDANLCTGTGATYNLAIGCQTIVVTNPVTTTATIGAAFSQTFTQTGAIGSATFTTASTLPSGMSLAPNGTLAGTPGQTGSFPIVVTVTDANGCTGTSATYTLVVSCQSITLSPATLPQGTTGTPYPATTFTQTGGIGSVTFSETGAVPNGMSFSIDTLAGTPTETGSFPITVTATDSNGCAASRDYLVVVACSGTSITLSPSSLPTVLAGSPFPSTTFTASGGTGPYTFAEAGALPTGMNFTGATLDGTPTQTGTFPITISATDSVGGCVGSQDYVVTVTCNGVAITVAPPTLASGPVGSPYGPVTFTPSGGTSPYTLAETGALPAGMTFSAGVLSGTPTQGGTFPIVVTATDVAGCSGATSYSLVTVCPTITVTNPGVTTGTVDAAFSQTFTETGAAGTATFTTSSTLPSGLTLAADGTLSGTPGQNGTFPIVVKVTDANGCTGTSATYTLVISCQTITVTNPGTATGTVDAPFSQTFTQTGVGTHTPATFTTSSTLPAGLTLSAAGVLSGTPSASGTFPIVVTVTDANGCTGAGATYTLVISCQTITVTNPLATAGTYNTAFSQTFTQAGVGIHTPATFTTVSTLPTGLSLSAAGVLSGTPLQTGSFPIVVTVTDANGCTGTSSTYTLAVGPKLTAKAYGDVGNTQLAGGVTAPATPSVSVVAASSGDASDTTITYAITVAPAHGTLTTFNTNGTFLYTPNVGSTTADSFTYTGTSNGISATQTATIGFSGMVWWVDNATASGTNDGRSNTPFKTMTAVNGAATNNGDFIYVFKGSGTTTGADTMKPSQQLIGAGTTLNVPTISPLVTIAGVDGNTPTIGGTITLAGNVTVAGIDMNTDTSNGIAGTSVSGVTMTVRNVATTTGTGVTIGGSGNSGTFLFRSISSNGAVNGISLTNTTGTFTVTGDGASDPANTTRGRTTAKLGGGSLTLGSGGTIQGTTGSGIILNNTGAVILQNMTIFNPSAGQGVNSGNNGITATSVNGLTLDNVFVNGFTGNSGLRGIPSGSAASITNLVMQHVDIDGNGTAVGTETNNNWNVRIDELAGNCGNGTAGCGWDNSLFFNSRENTFFITQGVTDTTVSTSMTITNCEFRDTTTFASPANDAFGISAFNNAVTNVTATGSTFKNVEVGGFQYNGNDNASGIVNVRNSAFENTGSDVLLAHGGGSGGNSTLTFDVSGNTTRQLTGNPASTVAFNFFLGGSSGAGSLMIGKIENNTIGNVAVSGSGSHVGDGIDVNATGAGTITATVTGNTVHQIHQGDAFFGEANSGSARLNLKIQSNSFNVDQNGTALAALQLVGGAVGTDTATLCADVSSNTLNGDPTYASVELDALGAVTSGITLVGYGGATDDSAAIASFFNSVNTSVTPAASASFIVPGGGHIQGGSCGVTFPP